MRDSELNIFSNNNAPNTIVIMTRGTEMTKFTNGLAIMSYKIAVFVGPKQLNINDFISFHITCHDHSLLKRNCKTLFI